MSTSLRMAVFWIKRKNCCNKRFSFKNKRRNRLHFYPCRCRLGTNTGDKKSHNMNTPKNKKNAPAGEVPYSDAPNPQWGDPEGRTAWIVDARHDYGKRYVVRAD